MKNDISCRPLGRGSSKNHFGPPSLTPFQKIHRVLKVKEILRIVKALGVLQIVEKRRISANKEMNEQIIVQKHGQASVAVLEDYQ